MANMKKVDVDRYYMNFAYQRDISKMETKHILENELEGYVPISLASEILNSRYIIRDPRKNIKDVLKYLFQMNEIIIRSYFQEQQQLKILGIRVYNFEYIREYIDYVTNVLLQLLVYRVINEESVETFSVIKKLSDKISEIDGAIEKQLSRSKAKWLKSKENGYKDLDAEIVSECFSMYVTHRSKFYEEYNIKKILIDEMHNFPSLFEDIPTEYKAEKVFIPEDEFKLVKEIITEGQHIDGYKDKIESVRTFIGIMACYGGRQCFPSCLQDLKVYFREIFISKSSYRRRKASRIVKEYIDQVVTAKKEGKVIPEFNKKSQYMFVREKISRGYFREKGLSKEYIEKVALEKKLYDLMLKLYLFYNVQDSLDFIYEVNNNLLKVYGLKIGERNF